MIQVRYDTYGNETERCNHWECPYKYCVFHEDYDETLNAIVDTPSEDANECMMYLDV